jgi:hypothetical protein
MLQTASVRNTQDPRASTQCQNWLAGWDASAREQPPGTAVAVQHALEDLLRATPTAQRARKKVTTNIVKKHTRLATGLPLRMPANVGEVSLDATWVSAALGWYASRAAAGGSANGGVHGAGSAGAGSAGTGAPAIPTPQSPVLALPVGGVSTPPASVDGFGPTDDVVFGLTSPTPPRGPPEVVEEHGQCRTRGVRRSGVQRAPAAGVGGVVGPVDGRPDWKWRAAASRMGEVVLDLGTKCSTLASTGTVYS